MNKAGFVLLFCAMIMILAACAAKKPYGAEYGEYTYMVAFNGNLYGFTDEEVPPEQIGAFIGKSTGNVSGKLPDNGEIGCKVSECKAPKGTVFYAIKDATFEQGIALKSANDSNPMYWLCVWVRKL